jgi:hypothetical protein
MIYEFVLMETERVHVQQSYCRFGHMACLGLDPHSGPWDESLPCIQDQLDSTERK